ncbi:Uncharacterized protein BP5553_00177 [Venustampulla echinocandica]|uniref:Cytochrome P450 n=1 Tax=Venustampulla echinocandica TaxID=2656787 RepID=A0A370TXI6_9HELO|nr:Uncharacterized protein BP5553_00177 [Venustampulla echinocandica]RDL40198.1 Uncharacterized protein BP5553_00177 [Venustampulla echinocandica]
MNSQDGMHAFRGFLVHEDIQSWAAYSRSLRGKSQAEIYRQWSQRYGPVFQVSLGNTTVVVINSAAAAKNLLIGQSAAFNSRPEFYVLHKVVSSQVSSIGTSPWDESCKKRRKSSATALNRVRTEGYAPILKLEATEFLKDILEHCENGSIDLDFRQYTRRFALNLSLTLNYGTRIADSKDLTGNPLLAEIIEVEAGISHYRQTARNLSNYIPLLRYVNPVLSKLGFGETPGAAAAMGARRVAYHDVLLRQLKARVDEGTDLPCIQGAVLKDPESAKLTEKELLSISLSMMAGADTSQPSLAWAILFLAHNPEIQQKAFEAIREAGILESKDFGNLRVPYVQALTKELGRYFTVLRLALPKATSGPAKWQNYEIPDNTVVFLNSWACGRDPDEVQDAWSFSPERWLGNSEKHPHQFAFGYGGRMCVASHVSHNALYTVYLHLIAHFQICAVEGETSKAALDPLEALADVEGTAATPRTFRAKFIPRDRAMLQDYILDVVETSRR